MSRVRQATRVILWGLVLLAIGFALYALVRNRPQDLPWRPLDLSEPVGMFTGRKLAGLADDFPSADSYWSRRACTICRSRRWCRASAAMPMACG